MTTVAFISRQQLTGTNGSSVYLLDLARAVRSAGMAPILVQPAPSLMGRTPVSRRSPEMDVFAAHHLRGVRRIGSRMVSLDLPTYRAAARGVIAALARRTGLAARWTRDRPLPYSVALPWSRADHRFVRRHLRDADIVIADYIFQSDAFADIAGDVPTAIVMHDLFSSRNVADEVGSGRELVSAIDAAAEAELLARADAVVTIQQTEGEWVRRHVPGARVILAPMAVRTSAVPRPGEDHRLLFVGSNTSPNVSGLRWFVDRVWPAIRQACPAAQLDVVGGVRRSFAAPIPGVTFLGFVPALERVYDGAGVVISPLLAGSGLKIKLVEAMGAGKAIVATSVTMQGVEDECRGAVVVADAPDDFARAVVRLLADREGRRALAARALEVARDRFSQTACYADFTAWLAEQRGSRTDQG